MTKFTRIDKWECGHHIEIRVVLVEAHLGCWFTYPVTQAKTSWTCVGSFKINAFASTSVSMECSVFKQLMFNLITYVQHTCFIHRHTALTSQSLLQLHWCLHLRPLHQAVSFSAFFTWPRQTTPLLLKLSSVHSSTVQSLVHICVTMLLHALSRRQSVVRFLSNAPSVPPHCCNNAFGNIIFSCSTSLLLAYPNRTDGFNLILDWQCFPSNLFWVLPWHNINQNMKLSQRILWTQPTAEPVVCQWSRRNARSNSEPGKHARKHWGDDDDSSCISSSTASTVYPCTTSLHPCIFSRKLTAYKGPGNVFSHTQKMFRNTVIVDMLSK